MRHTGKLGGFFMSYQHRLSSTQKSSQFAAVILALTAILIAACGKSHKSSSGNSSSGTTVANSQSLAVSYPEGMSVSSSDTTAPTSSSNDPTTVVYASGSLAIPTTTLTSSLTTADSYDPQAVPPKDRIIAAAKRLKGEADDCLPTNIFNPVPPKNPGCYNPDGDLVGVNTNLTTTPPSVPRFPTASGVTANGEACLAAFSRDQIAQVGAIVDQAQTLVEGMICAAYKANKTQKLPKAGETLDLAANLADITGAQVVPSTTDIVSPTGAPTPVSGAAPPKANFRFMKATIERKEDATDRAQFLSKIVMEVNGTVREIRLMHMPSLTNGNNDYIGRLSIRTIPVQRPGMTENNQNYLDLNYMLNLDTTDGSKPKTRYRLTRAMFNYDALKAMDKDPFAGVGQLDLNVGADFSGAENTAGYGRFPGDTAGNLNATMSRVNQIDYEGNPITNEGKLAFWVNPGGSYREPSRGMVADRKRLTADSTRLTGCAVSGAALGGDLGGVYSIRKAQKTSTLLKPTGYYHPNGQDDNTGLRVNTRCAAGDCQIAPYVYKQCYRQDDAGLYKPADNTDTTKNFDVINVRSTPGVIDDRMPSVDGKIGAPK